MHPAIAYYRQTGASYRALCPGRSGHMNMGYWPAESLKHAQAALVQDAVDAVRERVPDCRQLVDGGSGWGASARAFIGDNPSLCYVGVNVCADQVAAASALNRDLGDAVSYVEDDIVNHVSGMAAADAFVAIEAAHHFVDKAKLFTALRGRVRALVLLEICVEDDTFVQNDPLFRAGLGEAYSTEQYASLLSRLHFSRVTFDDVSARVFGGFANYLATWDRSGFDASPAVLRQFRHAFAKLARAAESGRVRYMRICAEGR